MTDNDDMLTQAAAFFERAQNVAESDNFDYAIDLFIEGLQRAPDEVERGHIALREMGIHRQGKGGKKPTVVEKMKHLRGKTPLEQLVNAAYLFAKDPDNLVYAEAILKAAVAGEYKKTAMWIADLIFQANNAREKPSFHTYVLLKDSYKAIGQFDRAITACQHASKLKPQEVDLADELKNLTAELTVARGKYNLDGDFRESIKDRQGQERLQSQQSVIKTDSYRLSAVQHAREVLARSPKAPMSIINLAQALAESESAEQENEAIDLLENAYKAKNDFTFKQRAGTIRIRQLKRKMRQAEAAFKANPDDTDAKTAVEQLAAQINETELEHYRVCSENYPTDLQLKYEYGLRLLRNKQYDQAIPLLQESQRDPRHRIQAMDKIGLCFFLKGWFADAIDIFSQAIDLHEIKDDAVAKELRYNLGRSYEEQGEPDEALKIFRKIAQLDFAYKDVSKRVDSLRKRSTDTSSQ